MLVLSRNIGEKVVIFEDIIVEVVEIRGGKVRLGFTAPLATPIHREEVFEKLKRQEREAKANPAIDAESQAG